MKEVFDRYRWLLKTYQPVIGRVLKTDCFNEGLDDYRSLGDILDPNRTTYLEIDPKTIKAATDRYPYWDFRHGDIREMPFEDFTFSTIFDLSTIDHVPPGDVPRVISEYRRTLKFHGKLVLVAWCAEGERRDDPVDWDGPQYFLHEPDLTDELRKGFQVNHREVIHEGEGIYLVEFVARKI